MANSVFVAWWSVHPLKGRGLAVSGRYFPRHDYNDTPHFQGIPARPAALAVTSHIGRVSPRSVARVLRTSNSTRIIPTKGTSPATMMIVSNECVASD